MRRLGKALVLIGAVLGLNGVGILLAYPYLRDSAPANFVLSIGCLIVGFLLVRGSRSKR